MLINKVFKVQPKKLNNEEFFSFLRKKSLFGTIKDGMLRYQK
jgi:hypothetical protein